MTVQTYPTPVVLSAATFRLLCPFSDLHGVVTDLAGWPVFTHHMGAGPLADGVMAKVIAQHPWIADLVIPEDLAGEAAVTAWLAPVLAEHGDTLPLELGDPLPYLSPFDGIPAGKPTVAAVIDGTPEETR